MCFGAMLGESRCGRGYVEAISRELRAFEWDTYLKCEELLGLASSCSSFIGAEVVLAS